MKICILHIDKPSLPLDGIETGPERFMRGITPYMNLDVQWSVIKTSLGEFPDVHDYDGYLMTGGGANHFEDAPWVVNLQKFVQDIYQAKIPMVGICWGHQFIAHALGGEMTVDAVGYQIGIKTSRLIRKLPWMKHTPDTVSLYSFHTRQVTKVPQGGEVFLSNDDCPIEGFSIGNTVFTLQQHPDHNLKLNEYLLHRNKTLTDQQRADGLQSLSQPHHTELSCQWIGDFFNQHRK